jgi:hypothetical protein
MGSKRGTPAPKGERLYIAVLEGGTEISKEGPFKTPEERDERARKVWNEECDQETDNVFGVDVDLDNPDDPLSVWNFSNGFMEDGPDATDEETP